MTRTRIDPFQAGVPTGGSASQVLTKNSSTDYDASWETPSAGSSGTVTSVALSLPAELTVSGSPVTVSGSLAAVWATQSANTIFAGPSSGSAATPTFRALAAADIPNISGAKITSGTVAAARLGTMTGDSGSGGASGTVPSPAAGDATKYLKGDATWGTITGLGLTATEVNLLDTFTDTSQTLLSAHASDGGYVWAQQTGAGSFPGTCLVSAAGRLRPGNDGLTAQYSSSYVPISDEYDILCDLYVATDTLTDTRIEFHADWSGSFSGGYFGLRMGSDLTWAIYSGSGITLGPIVSLTVGATYTLRFEVRKDHLNLFVNSVLTMSQGGYDTSLAGHGIGVYFECASVASGSRDTTGYHFDNLRVVSNGGMFNPMTAAGDLIYGAASGGETRLAKGSNGQVLTLVSGLPSWQPAVQSISIALNNGTSALAVGQYVDTVVEYACTLTAATLLADQSGSVVIDLRKCTYAQFDDSTHPVSGDSICASTKPTISSAVKSQDTSLTSWTTSLSAGDILRAYVVSATTITQATLSLKITRA